MSRRALTIGDLKFLPCHRPPGGTPRLVVEKACVNRADGARIEFMRTNYSPHAMTVIYTRPKLQTLEWYDRDPLEAQLLLNAFRQGEM